ncbi:hypothetical protein JOQ06_026273 [Pogonophryne albipinna]|uniref:Tc1-like transposase DDE domain-containing protein n=1 Tax=Pogonophryne albipinna TaxID=1090488 RepID=A0AAD6F3I4_9TELE|nr:hypothetical protein JOQ06_026273 [Pogonophryne albipinna]
MNNSNYVDILRDNMNKSALSLRLGRRWVFQHDNDPKHTSNLVQQFLKDTKTKVLEWPAQSPDLKPIEICRVLKVNVHARRPRNLDQLEQFAMEEWAKFPQETCANLVKNYSERLLSVVAQKGLNQRNWESQCSWMEEGRMEEGRMEEGRMEEGRMEEGVMEDEGKSIKRELVAV